MPQTKSNDKRPVVSTAGMERIHGGRSRAVEPRPEEIGQCTRCDVDISLPDAPKGLCAHCARMAR